MARFLYIRFFMAFLQDYCQNVEQGECLQFGGFVKSKPF